MTMSGIHHVTAISGRAYRNLDFYTGTLGMRFVKKTVNFDDPGTYDLYYGDEVGRPGTILTFFAWEHASPGRSGGGFTHQTAFCVPANSLGYWTRRFIEKGVPHEPLAKRFASRWLCSAILMECAWPWSVSPRPRRGGAARNYAGSLAGTPIFIGCGDVDSHIPIWRVHESTRVLRDLGAIVTERVYPGMGHTINDEEIRQVTKLVAQLE
jgi:catechol 2,3-dioxygenase-like lactoylglutathione lyase family enzyme